MYSLQLYLQVLGEFFFLLTKLLHSARTAIDRTTSVYLTMIPRARMGCESIAHDAEDQMGY